MWRDQERRRRIRTFETSGDLGGVEIFFVLVFRRRHR